MTIADNPPIENAAKASGRYVAEHAEAGLLHSSGEVQLTILIFIFGLIATGLFYLLVRSKLATPFLMRIYVVLILVFGSLLVVSSGYGTDQLTPVIGFFGTIAGYLLGRSDRPSDKQD